MKMIEGKFEYKGAIVKIKYCFEQIYAVNISFKDIKDFNHSFYETEYQEAVKRAKEEINSTLQFAENINKVFHKFVEAIKPVVNEMSKLNI